MAAAVLPTVRIQRDDFDVAAEIAKLTAGRADIGAVVTFSGLCRDEQGALSALELEHYPGMRFGRQVLERRGSGAGGDELALPQTRRLHRHPLRRRSFHRHESRTNPDCRSKDAAMLAGLKPRKIV